MELSGGRIALREESEASSSFTEHTRWTGQGVESSSGSYTLTGAAAEFWLRWVIESLDVATLTPVLLEEAPFAQQCE